MEQHPVHWIGFLAVDLKLYLHRYHGLRNRWGIIYHSNAGDQCPWKSLVWDGHQPECDVFLEQFRQRPVLRRPVLRYHNWGRHWRGSKLYRRARFDQYERWFYQCGSFLRWRGKHHRIFDPGGQHLYQNLCRQPFRPR